MIIEPNQDSFKLKSSGTSQAFIWLASELTKDPKADADTTLADSLESEEISLDSNDSFFPPLQWDACISSDFWCNYRAVVHSRLSQLTSDRTSSLQRTGTTTIDNIGTVPALLV